MFSLFEAGDLHPDHPLTGHFDLDTQEADVDAVLSEIRAVLAEEKQRQERLDAQDAPDDPSY